MRIYHEKILTRSNEVKEGGSYILKKGGDLYLVKVMEVSVDDQHFSVKTRDRETGKVLWIGGNFLGFVFDDDFLFDEEDSYEPGRNEEDIRERPVSRRAV